MQADMFGAAPAPKAAMRQALPALPSEFNPIICAGKVLPGWSGTFRPPVSHVCTNCRGTRFWVRGPVHKGWLCRNCYPPLPPFDEILEEVDVNVG